VLCELSFALCAVKLNSKRKERKEGRRKEAQRKARMNYRPLMLYL
jgi:hypothetical protein